MDTKSISVSNLETGEVFNTDIKLTNSKFAQKGHKMYNYGVDYLLDNFTNTEVKRAISMFDSSTVDYCNLLTVKFSKLFPTMDASHRSKFKRKLLDKNVLAEYNKKLMLNPVIFLPRGDKNIRNCQHLTQRVWKYLFEDCTAVSDDVVSHAEYMFGDLQSVDSKYLLVGSKEHSKLIPKPA